MAEKGDVRSRRSARRASAAIEAYEYSDELRQTSRLGLFHDVRPVDFDRPRANAHLVRDNLIGLTTSEAVKNFGFANAQDREQRFRFLGCRFVRSGVSSMGDGSVYWGASRLSETSGCGN
jgi:hypothetical protein